MSGFLRQEQHAKQLQLIVAPLEALYCLEMAEAVKKDLGNGQYFKHFLERQYALSTDSRASLLHHSTLIASTRFTRRLEHSSKSCCISSKWLAVVASQQVHSESLYSSARRSWLSSDPQSSPESLPQLIVFRARVL